VGRVISTDPALAGRLLALANSAESGAAEPITSINEAMMRLGIRAVRNVALGLSLVSGYRQGTCTAFDYDGYWARSLARAVAAQRLAHALRVGGPAEAYILGLLADIGSLALASVYPIAYGELLVSQEVSSREDFARAEEHRFAITHRKISGEMLLEWGLPEGFSRAVRDYEEYDMSAAPPGLSETTALLRAADAVAGLMVADEDLSGEVWRSLFQEFSLVERLSGLDREPFRAHCNAAMKAWAFADSGLTTLVSYMAPDNHRSRRLAEAIGGVFEPGGPDGCITYRYPAPSSLRVESLLAPRPVHHYGPVDA
jgi:HD-like signal output (HDOD) protein